MTEVNRRLQAFLKESGFEVLGVKGLGIEKVEDVDRVTQDGLLKFCVGVRETQPKANAILVSCGGLRTLEILAPLEQQGHIPAVSSTPHALWAGVRLLGLERARAGFRNAALESLTVQVQNVPIGIFEPRDSRRIPRVPDQRFPIGCVDGRNHSGSAHSCTGTGHRLNQILRG